MSFLKAFLILILLLINTKSYSQTDELSLDEFERAIKSNDFVLLDLQSDHNFKRGRIKKFTNIPFESESFESKLLEKVKLYDNILFYCTNQEENQLAFQFLKEIGYQKVKFLKGGFETWQSNSKPYASNLRSIKPYTNLSYQNLQAILVQNEFTLVDFYADWCKPCKKMNPILKEIAENDKSIKILKVNSDEAGSLVNHYGIEEIPTYIFFHNKNQVWRYSGEISKNELVAKLESLKN